MGGGDLGIERRHPRHRQPGVLPGEERVAEGQQRARQHRLDHGVVDVADQPEPGVRADDVHRRLDRLRVLDGEGDLRPARPEVAVDAQVEVPLAVTGRVVRAAADPDGDRRARRLRRHEAPPAAGVLDTDAGGPGRHQQHPGEQPDPALAAVPDVRHDRRPPAPAAQPAGDHGRHPGLDPGGAVQRAGARLVVRHAPILAHPGRRAAQAPASRRTSSMVSASSAVLSSR